MVIVSVALGCSLFAVVLIHLICKSLLPFLLKLGGSGSIQGDRKVIIRKVGLKGIGRMGGAKKENTDL